MQDRPAIGFEIKTVSNLIKRRLDESGLDKDLEGLTGMQGWIIGMIYHREQAGVDVFQRDLEKEFDIRRSTVTGLIKLMEQNELITREPVARDRRLKRLKLTARSRSIHERVSVKFRQMEDRLRTNLSEQEIHQFLDVLSKIKNNIS